MILGCKPLAQHANPIGASSQNMGIANVTALLFLALVGGCARTVRPVEHLPSATPKASDAPIAATTLMAHVAALTSLEMRGRAAGSEGERLAREYVTSKLRMIDASPFGQWAHPFPIRSGGESANVVGIIRGREDRIIVLGAHLDHLGERNGELFLGAEDNASGVAVVLEVARVLAERRSELKRSVVVAFFGGEEIGLLGSKAFVAHPPIPRERIDTMVNVDMIGRPLVDQSALALPKAALGIRDAWTVGLVGTKDRPELRALVDAACAAEKVEAVAGEDLPETIASVVEHFTKNRGDNASFEAAGIPAVFFSSGESDDYHQPTDTLEKLSGAIMTRRARAIVRVMLALSQR